MRAYGLKNEGAVRSTYPSVRRPGKKQARQTEAEIIAEANLPDCCFCDVGSHPCPVGHDDAPPRSTALEP